MYEGWLLRKRREEPSRNRFTGRTSYILGAGADGDERDRNVFLWRGHALAEAREPTMFESAETRAA